MQKTCFLSSPVACANNNPSSKSMVGCVRTLLPMSYSLNLRWISVRIEKVLGEGGFSFVYLAQDETSGVRARSFRSCTVTTTDVGHVHQKEFALKKIRCPTGTEGVELVMNEVAAYRRFKCVSQPLVHTSQLYNRVLGTPTLSDYMCVGFLSMRMQVDPTAGFGSAPRL